MLDKRNWGGRLADSYEKCSTKSLKYVCKPKNYQKAMLLHPKHTSCLLQPLLVFVLLFVIAVMCMWTPAICYYEYLPQHLPRRWRRVHISAFKTYPWIRFKCSIESFSFCFIYLLIKKANQNLSTKKFKQELNIFCFVFVLQGANKQHLLQIALVSLLFLLLWKINIKNLFTCFSFTCGSLVPTR